MIKEKDLFPEHYFIKCLPEFVDGDKIVHPGWKLFVDYLKKIEGGGEINGVNVGRYCLVGVNDNGVWATVEISGIAPGFTELTIDQWEAISTKIFYQESEKLSRIDDDEFNPVSNPKHYNSHPSGIECIEITRHHNFNIGNAIKYLWRQGLKDGSPSEEDLRKAIWYIEDEIKKVKK